MVFSHQKTWYRSSRKHVFEAVCWQLLLGKTILPTAVPVPSECAVSGVCSFNVNELLPIKLPIERVR